MADVTTFERLLKREMIRELTHAPFFRDDTRRYTEGRHISEILAQQRHIATDFVEEFFALGFDAEQIVDTSCGELRGFQYWRESGRVFGRYNTPSSRKKRWDGYRIQPPTSMVHALTEAILDDYVPLHCLHFRYAPKSPTKYDDAQPGFLFLPHFVPAIPVEEFAQARVKPPLTTRRGAKRPADYEAKELFAVDLGSFTPGDYYAYIEQEFYDSDAPQDTYGEPKWEAVRYLFPVVREWKKISDLSRRFNEAVEEHVAQVRADMKAFVENPFTAPPSGFLEGSLFTDEVFIGYKGRSIKVGHSLAPEGGREYGIYATPSFRYARAYGPQVARGFVNIQRPLVVENKGEISPTDLTEADVRHLEELGYDSIVSTSSSIEQATEFVLFYPEQIFITRTD